MDEAHVESTMTVQPRSSRLKFRCPYERQPATAVLPPTAFLDLAHHPRFATVTVAGRSDA